MKPLIVVLAGPNGAGKSTFFETYLTNLGLPFLNADVLAAQSGMDAYEAADQLATLRQILVERQIGFVMETVLSDPVGAKVDFLADALERGFDINLLYIGIADAQMSAERVASRVQVGGHDVPLEKIMARYERSLDNLQRAITRLPRVAIYDNSSFKNPYRLIAEFHSGARKNPPPATPPSWALRFLNEKPTSD